MHHALAQASSGSSVVATAVCFGVLLTLILVGVLIYKAISEDNSSKEAMVCKQCEAVGVPQTDMPGNLAIGCMLFLFFALPGIIYSVWRLMNKAEVCPHCGSEDMVPKNTPAGKRIIESHKN